MGQGVGMWEAKTDVTSLAFYRSLRYEPGVDMDEIESTDSPRKTIGDAKEAGIISAHTLREVHNFDENGGTTNIQKQLTAGEDIFGV